MAKTRRMAKNLIADYIGLLPDWKSIDKCLDILTKTLYNTRIRQNWYNNDTSNS